MGVGMARGRTSTDKPNEVMILTGPVGPPIQIPVLAGSSGVYVDRIVVDAQSGMFDDRQITVKVYLYAEPGASYFDALRRVAAIIEQVDEIEAKYPKRGPAPHEGPEDNSPMLGGDRRQERSDGLSA